MPVAEDEQTEQQAGSGSRTALKAAAAAAATGAATFAVRKALEHGGDGEDEGDGRPKSGPKRQGQQRPESILSTAAASAWESASDVVLPMAEDAVAAAGRYLAERAPDIVRERLVPRFIDAFNEAG